MNPKSEFKDKESGFLGLLPTMIRHYLNVYVALVKNSVVREMSFKTNFILWIIVELLWFCLQLSFIAVIYQHTDRIATWTKWEVVMLMGTSHFIQQIFSAIFLSNCVQLSENIRTGRLDFMLLLPVNTRFLISFRQIDLGGFVNAASALAVIAYAASKLQLSVSAGQIAGFVLLAFCGMLIHYSLMLILACISFWTVRAQGIVWGYYNLFNIARLPDAAFRGLFKAVFTFAIPMLLVSNVPVKVLIERLHHPIQASLLLLTCVLWLILSEFAWRFSVRHYTSASS